MYGCDLQQKDSTEGGGLQFLVSSLTFRGRSSPWGHRRAAGKQPTETPEVEAIWMEFSGSCRSFLPSYHGDDVAYFARAIRSTPPCVIWTIGICVMGAGSSIRQLGPVAGVRGSPRRGDIWRCRTLRPSRSTTNSTKTGRKRADRAQCHRDGVWIRAVRGSRAAVLTRGTLPSPLHCPYERD